MEKDSKFLASVALFAELYNSKKDIYSVLAELIKSIIISEAKWSFSSEDVETLLQEHFKFAIPTSVVRTTLKKRLQKEGFVKAEGGKFIVLGKSKNTDSIDEELKSHKDMQTGIISQLIEYVNKEKQIESSSEEQEKIKNSFYDYLLQNSIPDEHLRFISSFIIQNQNNIGFTEHLAIIKEGLIIYTGVQYSPDINEIGSWNDDLTIFLDTEILFYLAGLNGEIYEKIFDDLYNLILEINGTPSSGRIYLRYFEETAKEVKSFFYVAEQIVRNKAELDPSKTAMVSIVNGCKSADQVIEKETKFFDLLNSKNIKLQKKSEQYNNSHYNLEDLGTIKQIKESHPDSRYASDEEAQNLLGIFTKLNALRRGNHNLPFERIKYILLTGKREVIYISYSELIKENDGDFPLAIDIDSITNRIWFKLKKGFENKNSLPISFDAITKAQMALSSQIDKTLSQQYEELIEKRKSGELSRDAAISKYSRLRENQIRPEEIKAESLSDIIEFINEESLEDYSNEKAYLENQINVTKDSLNKTKIEKENKEVENKRLKAELAQRKSNEKSLRKKLFDQKREKKRPLKLKAKSIYYISLTLSCVGVLLIIYLIYFGVNLIATPQDTSVGKWGLIITTIAGIIGVLGYFKLNAFLKWIKSKVQKYYLKLIKELE